MIITFRKSKVEERVHSHHPFQIQRGKRVLDKIFIHVIILLVIVAYINMGCAIDLRVIKETLRRPVAPAIGLASQYLFMPIVSVQLPFFSRCIDRMSHGLSSSIGGRKTARSVKKKINGILINFFNFINVECNCHGHVCL